MLSPLLGSTDQKKIPLKKLLLIYNAPGHPTALTEMYRINVAFMPAHTTSILQSMDERVILIFKSSYLRYTFCKTVTALDRDSSDGYGQSQSKTCWKGFAILDATKNIHD